MPASSRLLAAVLATAAAVAAAAATTEPVPFSGDEGCTTIVVGKQASGSGGPMTTHSNDCNDCDFRLGKVPAMDHPAHTLRPVVLGRQAYPRYVGEDRGETYKAQHVDTTVYDWEATEAMGYIPQVPHTFAYVDGEYGVINEHGLAMGESTCGSVLVNRPIFAGGEALMDVRTLSRVAMERTKTARDAIRLMGALAEEHGYYGAQWKGSSSKGEAGETLTVADPEEAWVFHVVPDGTDAGAVWAAQRVPDDGVAVIANQFVIRQVDLSDPDTYMGSSNMRDVAAREGLWDPDKDGAFDFTRAYALPRDHHVYATRRVWRVFTVLAPSLADSLSPHTSPLADDYPFAVTPDAPVKVQDLLALHRDHYEGTEFDLTQGLAGGPYGDPSRFDPAPTATTTQEEVDSGNYERAISLYRTSYSTCTQSRAGLPGVVWFGVGAPATGVYVPIYAAVDVIPDAYRTGSLYRYTEEAAFWVSTAVGNWAKRFYSHTIGDVQAAQAEIEGALFAEQPEVEALALAAGDEGADLVLDAYTHRAARATHQAWTDLLYGLFAKFHDGYRVDDLHAETIAPTKLFYPEWWLDVTGYFDVGDRQAVPQGEAAILPASVTDATAGLLVTMAFAGSLAVGLGWTRVYYSV